MEQVALSLSEPEVKPFLKKNMVDSCRLTPDRKPDFCTISFPWAWKADSSLNSPHAMSQCGFVQSSSLRADIGDHCSCLQMQSADSCYRDLTPALTSAPQHAVGSVVIRLENDTHNLQDFSLLILWSFDKSLCMFSIVKGFSILTTAILHVISLYLSEINL